MEVEGAIARDKDMDNEDMDDEDVDDESFGKCNATLLATEHRENEFLERE